MEVRSVNNRYLDCTVKMPRAYMFAEDAIKSTVQRSISRGKTTVVHPGAYTHLDFTLPGHYTRKRIRSMGRVSLLSTRATELALEQSGLIDDPVIKSGRTGIAYGSCTGSTRAVADFGEMIVNRNTRGITATTYVQMMPHTTAVNTGLFFGITGRVIPTPSACTSGSQAIGYAWEAVSYTHLTLGRDRRDAHHHVHHEQRDGRARAASGLAARHGPRHGRLRLAAR